ncbi:hypothetical protein [Agromyces laixinhei]|uniref:TY-Chap2 family putative peptide chaperone n=1 Tax=Agromyces laixinhei TaxID=2585717 RepID=UPI0012EDC1B1|nr:hypothetical protein [Agromyces laixinhei]
MNGSGMNDDGASANDVLEDYYPPADRFLLAQTWWIVSELCRRHPHLRAGTVQAPDGYRLVLVYDEPDAYRVQFDLVGGAKFKLGDEVHTISWIEMMAPGNAHEIVKRIEVESGLGIPKNTPATTARSLVYRVIAAALAAGVNDRHDWYAEEVAFDFDTDFGRHPVFSHFPTIPDAAAGHLRALAAQLAAEQRGQVVFQAPMIALMRNHVPAVVFDLAGVAHTLDGAKELLPMYREINDNLTLTMMQIVGPRLP